MRRLRYFLFVGVCAALALVAVPAVAQESDPPVVSGSETVTTLPPEVGGETVEARTPSETPVEVAGAVEDPGALPFTGGDVIALVVLGAVALGVGALLVYRSRARSRLRTI